MCGISDDVWQLLLASGYTAVFGVDRSFIALKAPLRNDLALALSDDLIRV